MGFSAGASRALSCVVPAGFFGFGLNQFSVFAFAALPSDFHGRS